MSIRNIKKSSEGQRQNSKGPIEDLRVLAELIPTEKRRGAPVERADEQSTGTKLIYQVWAKPKNILGLIAIPSQIGLLSARNFARPFREYAERASGGRFTQALPSRARLVPGGRARLLTLSEKMAAQGDDNDLIALLVEYIENAAEFSVARIRPYELARPWGQAKRAGVATCVCAAGAGILDLQLNLICPMCRGGGASTT